MGARLRSEGDFPPSGSVSLWHPDSGSSATVASLSSEFMSAEKNRFLVAAFYSASQVMICMELGLAWKTSSPSL